MTKSSKHTKPRRDIYQEVTDRIIGYLEEGTAPWRNPIIRGTGDGWPKNMHSGKRYRGINVLLLAMQAFQAGYSSDYWLTYKQACDKGGSVRKGEKGTLVTFWKMLESKDKPSEEPAKIPMLRHYVAFNLDQIDGLEPPDAPVPDLTQTFQPIARAEAIIKGYRDAPAIHHDGGRRAFYRPRTDSIHMPVPERFTSSEDYFATLFHELSHSTGAEKRLNRGFQSDPAPFGSPDYSREELVAELSSAFICAVSGISSPTIAQSAAYLNGWIEVLRGDKRLIVQAASAAQKSADWVLGEEFGTAAQDDPPVALDAQQQATSSSAEAAVSQPGTGSQQLDLF